jgi:two-component sensor histidine kinase
VSQEQPSHEEQGWFASRFARLSTGLKMFLILSLALFPLGLIAILASLESARDNSAGRAQHIFGRLEVKAQRINSLLSRSSGTIRAASAAIAVSPGSDVCRVTLARLARAQVTTGRYALYGGGPRPRCATPGFAPAPIANPERRPSIIEISPDGRILRFALYDDADNPEGMGEFTRESLAELTLLPGTRGNFDLELLQGGRGMMLRNGYQGGPLVQSVTGTEPVAGDRLQLRIRQSAVPISPVELLMILLPVMMWLGAGIIGWLILDRLLLKPLVRMQRAVAAYRPGDQHLDLPAISSPAREIGELGAAFDRVTQTVARHEAELEAAVERQRRLVREVHHRVKNNLQVVASLLNLHARGVANEEVAAAYASIQRRVDALAVVHRNHYAELEENRGVALRSLISELGANLRATAPASAGAMAIRIDIEPYYATQDVAVSVAFLITELVEYAMFCGARAVSISLTGGRGPAALLAVESDSLIAGAECAPELTERFERIVTGLSRQLRSTLDRDAERGRYALEIAVVDKAER